MKNFVTKTYDSEAHVTLCTAQKINELYPESKFYIYEGGLDKGLSAENKKLLSDVENTELISWEEPNPIDSKISITEKYISKVESNIRDSTYLNHLINELLGYEYNYLTQYKLKRYDHHHNQKPLVIRDITSDVDGNIIWIDADVVILQNIDEIFQYDFDIGATVRNKYAEIRRREYRDDLDPASLSTGVLIFNTESDKIFEFINKWLREFNSLRLTKIREQTAVENLFKKSNEMILESYYNEGQLETKSYTLKTKIFPAKKYNHFKLMSGINPNKHKILHFPQEQSTLQINKNLISDIQNDDFETWYRN